MKTITLTANKFQICQNITLTANEESKSLIYGRYISFELPYIGVGLKNRPSCWHTLAIYNNANVSSFSMAWKHGHTTDDVLEGVKHECH